MSFYSVRILTVCLLASLAGCGGDDTITMEQFIQEYPVAYCNVHYKCCNRSQAEQNYPSIEICKKKQSYKVEAILGFKTLASPFATFEEKTAKACLDKLRKADCKDPSLSDGCLNDRLVTPRHKETDECNHNSECASFYCIVKKAGDKGYCSGKGSGCYQGLSADGKNTGGDDRACPQGSYCKGNQCVSKLEVSKPCSEPRQCASDVCSPTYKICVNYQPPRCDGT